jgi:hypothetical protein
MDANGQPSQTANYITVTPNYFATLRTPLQGREFNERDTAASPFVVVINQTMAKRYWPTESPIGKQIRLDYVPDEPLREIVGWKRILTGRCSCEAVRTSVGSLWSQSRQGWRRSGSTVLWLGCREDT